MFFIAFRQMTARKMQTFLTLLGIVFGSMGYIVISGVMLGFREYLLEQLVNNDAHVKVSPRLEIITREGTEKLLFDQKENISWISEPAGRKDNSEIRSASHWYNLLSNDPDVEAFSRQLASKVIITKGSLTDAG
ncbi:MAG TPA: ABC transporter permease, partial [Leptospiraceae bacterium]|nr:ABC transporter permease [Leptospiraceae bacterium]